MAKLLKTEATATLGVSSFSQSLVDIAFGRLVINADANKMDVESVERSRTPHFGQLNLPKVTFQAGQLAYLHADIESRRQD